MQGLRGLTRDRNCTRFRRMVRLPVASRLRNDNPSILAQKLKNLPHLHQYTPTTVVAAKPRYGLTPLTPSHGYLALGFSRSPSSRSWKRGMKSSLVNVVSITRPVCPASTTLV